MRAQGARDRRILNALRRNGRGCTLQQLVNRGAGRSIREDVVAEVIDQSRQLVLVCTAG